MKPSVKLLAGRHITAADKRNILASIEFLRDKDPETWATTYVGLKRSPKSYGIKPDPERPGRYGVVIRTNYRNDWGAPREELSTVLIEVAGADPLPLGAICPWVASQAPAPTFPPDIAPIGNPRPEHRQRRRRAARPSGADEWE